MLRRLLFHNFHTVHRIDEWVRDRFTPAGRIVLGLLVGASLFGIDVRETFAYQTMALAAAALLIACAHVFFYRVRLRCARRLPRYATLGEPLHYTVSVRNLGTAMERGLVLRERTDTSLPTYADFARSRDPAGAASNLFDRYVGYPRWSALVRRRRGVEVVEREVPDLAPGTSAEVDLVLTPLRRGAVRLRGIAVGRSDPLGLFKAFAVSPAEASVLVLPRRHPANWVDLAGARTGRPGGRNPVAATGMSEELIGVREYRPGDPMRHLHWKRWARLGEPVVKEFHSELHLRHAVLLDTCAGGDAGAEEGRFEAAVSVAASLVCAGAERQGLLDLIVVGERAGRYSSGRGSAPADSILEVLACVRPSTGGEFPAGEGPPGALLDGVDGCVCVLLDWDAPRREFVRRLRLAEVPLQVVVLQDAPAPALDPGPLADQPDRLRVVQADRVAQGLAALAGPAPEIRRHGHAA